MWFDISCNISNLYSCLLKNAYLVKDLTPRIEVFKRKQDNSKVEILVFIDLERTTFS